MSSKGPLWLRAVHRLERAVGEPVESVVRSDRYFDVVSKVTRVTGKAKGKAESVSRRGLHLLNLPAGSDVSRMREQLLRMERRLNQLTENVEELDGAPRPRRARAD
jgi:hypothetical protein